MALLASLTRTLWTALVVVLAICHLNHPRLWIQDLLCSASLYWIPFVLGDLCRNLFRALKTRAIPALGIVLIIAEAYLVARVSSLAMPYIVPPPEPPLSAEPLPVVLFSHTDFSPGGVAALVEAASARNPGLVVLVGEPAQLDAAEAAIGASIGAFPSVFESPRRAGRAVRILSRWPAEPGDTGLGAGALPGLFVRLRVGDRAMPVLVGALDLLPAASQQDFFKSKVTSRRLATLMRYSREPRMVLGSFEATQFSPIVSMYTRQLRLRPAAAGHGIVRTYDAADPLIRLTLDHAFVSSAMYVSSFEVIPGISARRFSFAFRASFTNEPQP